jgi:competence protein ComEC
MRHAAAIPTISLLAGAALGSLLADPPYFIASIAMAAAIVGAVAALCTQRPFALAIAVACGFAAGGALQSSVAWQRAWRPPLRIAFEALVREERAAAEREGRRLPLDDEAVMVIEGTLRADASLSGAGAAINVDVDRTGGVQLTVIGQLARDHLGDWRAGRRLRAPAQLRRPSRYLDPGVPDNERALARRGVTLVGTVKSGALVEVLAGGGWWSETLGAIRAFARRAIANHVARWNPQSGAIVTAIVIGDRTALDADVERRLQEAGTYHVIAISGGNIAILVGVVVALLRGAGWLGRPGTVAIVAILIAYAQLVGGGASVDRATLMAVVHLGARMFDQRSPPVNVLAVAASLLAATDPLSIADPAFLLTFGATLAIVVVIPAANIAGLSSPVRFFIVMLLTSAAVEAVLLPIGAFFFQRVTVAGLVLNFAAIPLMAVAQIAGMLVVPAALVSWHAAAAIGWIAHLGASALVESAGLVRIAPSVAWRVAAPGAGACTVYYVALAVAWIAWRRRTPAVLRATTTAAAIAAVIWIAIDPRTIVGSHGDGQLHATFLDVGQGDAIFIVFPRGATLLVDAGGLGASSSFDIGDRVVAPVIRAAGFRRIDRLALTHGDPDHIGGGPAIVHEFKPHEVWEGIPVPRSDALTRLRLDAQAGGARWANVYSGDRIVIDDVTVAALHPERADWERQKVRNDDSLVLELRWRDVSIVLTGDIGRIPESRLAHLLEPARVRIVKIPHHGSLTSSSPPFIAALQAHIAIVSAGRNNHFGHPVPEVLDRYEHAGVKVFRTDRDGAVTVTTDGASVAVETYASKACHEDSKTRRTC